MSSSNQGERGGLFREEAISAIDSVEKFDEAIAVVSSHSILALAIIGGLLLLLIGWSVFGRIPVGLQGRGVIVAGSGIAPVVAAAEGTIIELPAHVGDTVPLGAAVARMRTTAGDVVALRAPVAGVLAQRSPQVGSFVRQGDAIATIEPAGANPTAVVFVPGRNGPSSNGRAAGTAFAGGRQARRFWFPSRPRHLCGAVSRKRRPHPSGPSDRRGRRRFLT